MSESFIPPPNCATLTCWLTLSALPAPRPCGRPLEQTVRLDYLAIHIAEQGKREAVFLLEFFLGRGRIGAHADYRRSQLLKVTVGIAEPACFPHSAGGVGP